MATFLDITLLGGAKVVFTFLLVYVIVWGLLTWIKPFGKATGSGAYAIIAFVAAFFAVLSGTVRLLIEFVTPWFLFFVIFLFFIIFMVRMFNVDEGGLNAIIRNGTVQVLLIVIVLIILFFGLGEAFGQKALETTQGQQAGVYYNPDMGTGVTGTDDTGGVLQPTDTTLQPGDDLNTGGMTAPQPGQPGATATPNFSTNVINTLLHPKVMGIIAVLLIATVTVWLIGRPEFI